MIIRAGGKVAIFAAHPGMKIDNISIDMIRPLAQRNGMIDAAGGDIGCSLSESNTQTHQCTPKSWEIRTLGDDPADRLKKRRMTQKINQRINKLNNLGFNW